MTTWLIIFLVMSLALNIMMFKAYSSLYRRFSEMEEMFKDFEKMHGSMEKLVGRHRKYFVAKKGR
jgi:hypothetical protein